MIANSINLASDGRAVVLVGEDDWPFPAPLVRQGDRWVFDAAAGREEIINRRIGRNELDTIQTLLAIVDAQREYAVDDLDGNGSNDLRPAFCLQRGHSRRPFLAGRGRPAAKSAGTAGWRSDARRLRQRKQPTGSRRRIMAIVTGC
jgi:hypothetical protein